jgi:hypothetical protein
MRGETSILPRPGIDTVCREWLVVDVAGRWAMYDCLMAANL